MIGDDPFFFAAFFFGAVFFTAFFAFLAVFFAFLTTFFTVFFRGLLCRLFLCCFLGHVDSFVGVGFFVERSLAALTAGMAERLVGVFQRAFRRLHAPFTATAAAILFFVAFFFAGEP